MRLISDDAIAALTIFQEAEGEPMAGKVAVAEVIYNRTLFKFMCDGTVADACLRAFQFSGMNTTSKNRVRSFLIDNANPLVLECLDAWHQAQGGSNTVKGAVLYYNPALVPEKPVWADPNKYVGTVGRHDFFTS